MKKILLSVVLLTTVLLCNAQLPQKKIEVDLPEMYEEVDDAIAQSQKYIRQHEEKIDEAKQLVPTAESDQQRLVILMQICELYDGFNGDSALAYTIRTAEMARKLEATDVEADYRARAAYLCTFLGSQTEALTLLSHIDKRLLSNDGLVIYYRAYLSAYETLADNCKTSALRKLFRRQHFLYRDSLLHAAGEGSELYYFYCEDQLIKEGKLQQALKMNDARLNQSGSGSHQDAIIAYSRYRIFEKSGKKELALYWLCRSALADIQNAVMDQMSLISLAKELDANGDFARASRYINFTWQCNRRYSPHMRSWQIAPLLSAIENNYQTQLDQKSKYLMVSIACAVVFFFLWVVAIVSHKLRRRKEKAKETDN